MSILIKGMEMPKNCGECLLAKLSPTGESLICNYMLSRVSWEERPFDCPLVPVPKHGRLIDADALIAWFEEWYDPNADLEICHVIDILDDNSVTPTIFEEEEGET